jgi:hypothetical protein
MVELDRHYHCVPHTSFIARPKMPLEYRLDAELMSVTDPIAEPRAI